MKRLRHSTAVVLAGAVSLGFVHVATAGSADKTAKDKAAKAHAAIGAYLETHPEMAIDLAKVSGEYCFNTWKVKGGHMTHYAIDPSKTTEDVIDFVRAKPLADAGIDVTKLPQLPSKLGAMKNDQWYYVAKGGVDPHHGWTVSRGKPAPLAMIVRAANIQ